MGTALTDEVEAALHKTEIIDPAQQEGAEITRIVGAVEAFVKLKCGRNFEEVTYTDQPYDVEPGTRDLLLTDIPIQVLTSISEVIYRNEDGSVVTQPIAVNRYVTDKAAGIISLLDGGIFNPGLQALRLTWKAGYTPAEITANANNEIRVLKQLCLSIIAHWFQMHKEGGGGHIQSISLPTGEILTISFDLTPEERLMVNQLRRW
jgi:hypothetical protein